MCVARVCVYLYWLTLFALQLIALAGIGRTIKIIDPVAGKLMCTLVGHGEEIYELQFAGE